MRSGLRPFIIGLTSLVIALVVAAVIWLPAAQAMPEAASAGQRVWEANGCAGCHTLYGHGGSYAPDLTHIYSARGASYLHEFLLNPSAFHPDERIMPRFGLTVSETSNLLTFLQWVDIQSAAWPPRAINVRTGGAIVLPAEADAAAEASSADGNAAARGRALFMRPPANCTTCHSLEPEVIIVGPSLAGIATRAAERIPGTSAESYLRQSILDPGAFVVPGFPDAMARNLPDVLTSDEIEDLLAFLMTLDAS